MHLTITFLLSSPPRTRPLPSYAPQLPFLPLWLLPLATSPHSSPTLILVLDVAPPTMITSPDVPCEARVFTPNTGVVLRPFFIFAYICFSFCEHLLLIEHVIYFSLNTRFTLIFFLLHESCYDSCLICYDSCLICYDSCLTYYDFMLDLL